MKIQCSNCKKEIEVKPSRLKRSKDICCSLECASILKKITSLGDKNPNCKYNTDETLFDDIENEKIAWVLGWIASDGNIREDGSITIQIKNIDKAVLNQIQEIVNPKIPIRTVLPDQVKYTFCSKKLAEKVCKLLSITYGKKSDIVRMPKFKDDNNAFCFIRGYFEGDGSIRKITDTRRVTPECSIFSNSIGMLEDIQKYSNGKIANHHISWYGTNALDFLGKIYDNSFYHMPRKRDLYLDICLWQPMYSSKTIDHIRFNLTRPDAVAPSKSNVSDSGYDLTLLEKVRTFGRIELYDTGVKVNPPFGYYFDLVPRSSITKSGYMLANSVGIIDRSYIGNILVPLIKVDENAKDLELPIRLVQLVPREVVHFEIEEVDELDDTARGINGFGSTGRN